MKSVITLFIFILSMNVFSQNWLKVDSVFAVSGVTVKSFSAPVFADMNNDGTQDLFLGNITDITDFFWNNSDNFPSTFSKDSSVLWSIYSGGLANTNSDYPAVVDLDNDDDLDLIISGYNGLLYYENIGTVSEPDFFKIDTIFTNVNAMIGSDAKPAFVDIDGDGDFDLFIGTGESLLGGPDPGITMGFRNTGTETNPEFTFDNTLVAGLPDIGLNAYPAFADLDNDGDYDLLLGRDLQTFVHYRNTGTNQNPVWTLNTNTFSGVEAQTYWKNPTFVDLDYDGDMDLVYGQSSGILYVYRNNGTPDSPLFQFYPDYFRVIKLNGSGGTSFLADFDNDGDKDLLSGMWDGKFYYFRNDGSNSKPVFNPISTSFSNLTVNSYSSPIFVDLDEDGDLDIVSGSLYGQINYYVNNNGSFTADSSIFGFIDVGWMSVPAFADLDGDGDLDLLVSSETGSDYRFYMNEGNNVFVENSTMFSNITFPNYSRSTLADVDNDGDIDLIIGRSNGSITYYRNDGTVNTPLWVNANTEFEGIKVKQNAHAGFADLDGDGRPDMVLAEYDGNFTYYKNLFAISSSENEKEIVIEEFQLFQNYPNPFNPATLISWQSSVDGMQSLKIYDVLGNEVTTLVNEFRPAGMYEVEFDGSRLSSGVYFYKVEINGIEASTSFSKIRKMILIK